MAKSNGLRDLRMSKGWTQKMLAEKLGVEHSTVSNYERGARKPNPEVLLLLREVFDISLSEAYGLFYALKPEQSKVS